MKKIIRVILFLLPCSANALFDTPFPQARPAGTAYAFTALATDINALSINPGGLGLLPYPELQLGYAKPFMSLDDGSISSDNMVSFGAPIRIPYREKKQKAGGYAYIDGGAAALSFRRSRISSAYQEDTLALCFARELIANGFFGFTVRQLKLTYDPGIYGQSSVDDEGNSTGLPDPFLRSKTSCSGIGLDLGLMYQLLLRKSSTIYDRYMFALTAKNVVSPDLTLAGPSYSPVPQYACALGYNHNKLKIDLEYERTAAGGTLSDNRFGVGMESWISLKNYGKAAFRSGFAFHSSQSHQFAVGCSYIFRNYELDYAYTLPIDQMTDTGGGSLVSFVYRFGNVESGLEPNLLIQKKRKEREALEKTLNDVKQKTAQDRAQMKRIEIELENQRAASSSGGFSSGDKAEDISKSYEVAYGVYKKIVKNDAPYNDRRIYLEKILTDYKGTVVDVSTAEKDLVDVNKVIANGKNDYDLSWLYYQRLIERGADVRERRRVLIEMKKKFSFLGIDSIRIDNELKKIQKSE